MPKLERRRRESQISSNLNSKQGFGEYEIDSAVPPTENFRGLSLTDGRQDAIAWTDSNSGGRRQSYTGTQGRPSEAKYSPSSNAISRSSSSSYTSLPRAPFFNQANDSVFPGDLPDHASSTTPSSTSGYNSDQDIGEPPSYEASVASDSASGRRHPQDGSYNSTSSSMSTWDMSTIDMKGGSHRRETANASDPTPSPIAPSPIDDQAELLPYLRDAYEELDGLGGRGEEYGQQSSSSTMPNVAVQQFPPDMLRQNYPPSGANLTAIVPPPPAIRTVSEPSPLPALERPQLPPRGMTISPRFPGTADLDRIDELDETTPHGYSLHHRGPYEFQGSTATPPPCRKPDIRRAENFQQPPQILVEDASFSQPPIPVPFKLNLQPGGILTRLPPTSGNGRYSYAGTPQRAPLAPIIPYALSQKAFTASRPIYGNIRPDLRDTAYGFEGPRYQPSDQTAMQYGNQMYAPRRASSADPTLQAQRANSRNGFPTPTSSANSSRSDFRAYPNPSIATDSDYSSADERRGFSPGHLMAQQENAYDMQQRGPAPSQFSPQPTYSSSASILSRADTSRSRLDGGPPRPVDFHRPKHLVMPAPLQQQGTDNRLPNPYSPNLFPPPSQPTFVDPIPAPKSSAASIPIHDPRKGNLLKKRMSKSESPHENHQHLAPVHMPESNNNSVMSFGRGLEPEPELKAKKSGRKLSKRRNIS